MKKIAGLIACIILAAGCAKEAKLEKFAFKGMGSFLDVTYIGNKEPNMEQEIKNMVKMVEDDVSYYNKSSYVSKINNEAHLNPIKVPHYVCELFEKSI